MTINNWKTQYVPSVPLYWWTKKPWIPHYGSNCFSNEMLVFDIMVHCLFIALWIASESLEGLDRGSFRFRDKCACQLPYTFYVVFEILRKYQLLPIHTMTRMMRTHLYRSAHWFPALFHQCRFADFVVTTAWHKTRGPTRLPSPFPFCVCECLCKQIWNTPTS